MNSIKKKVACLVITVSVLASGVGVYAGTVLQSYKTPRGTMATVENEEVHKNRVSLSLNGKTMKVETWYVNNMTYVPLRQVAEGLGATVNYNAKTYHTDLVSSPIPVNPDGTYEGVYVDGSGVMRAKIVIKGQRATMEFKPDSKNKKGMSGSYQMSVRYNSNTGLIELTGDKWTNKPKNAQMIDFKGGLNKSYMNGAVVKSNGTFSFMKK